MPSVSERQRRLFGIAESIKKGKTDAGYSPQAAKIAKSQLLETIRDFSRSPLKKVLGERRPR